MGTRSDAGTTPHRMEWDDRRVRDFWDYTAGSKAGVVESFSRQVGAGVARLIADIAPVQMGGNVLDFGCGPGYLLEAMASFGGSLWGTDVSAGSLAKARARLADRPNVRELVQIVDGKGTPEVRWDLITCVETVEHVLEPQMDGFLECLRGLAGASGLVFLTTPNDEDLEMADVFCPGCGSVFHRWQHQRAFDAVSLKRLMETHGFRTVGCAVTDFGRIQSLPAGASLMPAIGTGPHLFWIGTAA